MEEFDKSACTKRIQRLLYESDIPRAKLAKLLGVGDFTITAYMTGKAFPRIETLAKMCIALEVSADYILFGDQLYE